MRAMVVYESMFGDNRQVALAISAGLTETGITSEAAEVGGAPTTDIPDLDLIVVGAPNHGFSLPRESTRKDAATKTDEDLVSRGTGVREWLSAVVLPRGVRTAAYDTRASHPKALTRMDHASGTIEKSLAKRGGIRLLPAEHFFVADMTGPLEPGEEDRARAWGVTLGRLRLDGLAARER